MHLPPFQNTKCGALISLVAFCVSLVGSDLLFAAYICIVDVDGRDAAGGENSSSLSSNSSNSVKTKTRSNFRPGHKRSKSVDLRAVLSATRGGQDK